MGMPIDKAIKLMIQGCKDDYDGSAEDFCEAYDMSIEVMRKYQKIKQILKEPCIIPEGCYPILKKIKRVVEDGNNN